MEAVLTTKGQAVRGGYGEFLGLMKNFGQTGVLHGDSGCASEHICIWYEAFASGTFHL